MYSTMSAYQSKLSSSPCKHFPKRLPKPFADNRIYQWVTSSIEKIKEKTNSKHHMGVSFEYGVTKEEQINYTEQGQREN